MTQPGVDGQAQADGLDVEAVGAWLTKREIVRGTLRASLITGGRSNLTYQLTDAHSRWVVRRPPLGHVLETAHDMSREARVLSALAGSPVPVPRIVGLCEDISVIGAPFLVMEHVAGDTLRSASELEERGLEFAARASAHLVETLTAVHETDIEALGLADFGRSEGFLARQVNRWRKQLDASRRRPLPVADELYHALSKAIPAQSRDGLVHGDYRLDNVLLDPTGSITAVLDWEMATIGDPLTDLGLLMLYVDIGARYGGSMIPDAPAAPGFLTADEIADHYATRTGQDLSSLSFYLGLASFKLAAVLEGIHARHADGLTVGGGFEQAGLLVEPILEMGLTRLARRR